MLMGKEASSLVPIGGLRQGNPLSPLLVNLVADALGVMLEKAINK
jgi:hypothetical protein